MAGKTKQNPNWKISREDVIGAAVAAVTRYHYTVEGVVDNMVQWHYQGVSRELAAAKLLPEVRAGVAAVVRQQRDQELAELQQMEQELEAEGWRFLWDVTGFGGFWLHATGVSVNNMGGCFASRAEATRRTHASATRELKRVSGWADWVAQEGVEVDEGNWNCEMVQ